MIPFVYPATFIVAFSLYFLRFPLLVTVPIALLPWLGANAAIGLHQWMWDRKQESTEDRYKRWFGDRWREELAMNGAS